MVLSSLLCLSLFGKLRRLRVPGIPRIPGIRRRSSEALASDELDVAIAGAQIGLERKRRRWLLFLIEKQERLTLRLAQVTPEMEIDMPDLAGKLHNSGLDECEIAGERETA